MMMKMMGETTPKSAKNTSSSSSLSLSSPPKKEKKVALDCPRCNSNNTKFCYYNNYSLNQPRYFCKSCKRYWTQGGSLRSIPVGGRSRKVNKRSSTRVIRQNLPDLVDRQSVSNNNNIYHMNCQQVSGVYNSMLTNPNPKYGQDLNLGFMASPPNLFLNDPYSYYDSKNALDANNLVQILTGIRAPFGPGPNNHSGYPVGLSLQSDPRITLPGADGRVLFPFEDLRSSTTTIVSAPIDDHGHHQQAPTGYWSGNINLGGAGAW